MKDNNGENLYPRPSFPIGFMIMMINDDDPSIYFGGVWIRVAKGKTLVGVDEDDPDFDAPQKTGGEKRTYIDT